jgi:hypothetical protein
MLPHPPELASIIRRVSSSIGTYQSDATSSRVIYCRNGSVLTASYHAREHRSILGVYNLMRPERGMVDVVIPKLPCHEFQHTFSESQVICKEEEGNLSYFCVSILYAMKVSPTMLIYKLQDGAWCMHNLPIEQLPHPWSGLKSVLVDNKIYMKAQLSGFIILDLLTSSFSTIGVPQGVEYNYYNTILSRADAAASVYLVHVKQLLLCIWLYNTDDWLLVDTICLRDMCASLTMIDCNASFRLNLVGDNAEFVLLDSGGA